MNHPLREGRGELRHHLDLAVVDPLVDEPVRVLGDHLAMAIGADRPHPGVGDHLPVHLVLLDGRAHVPLGVDELAHAFLAEDRLLLLVLLVLAGRGEGLGIAHDP